MNDIPEKIDGRRLNGGARPKVRADDRRGRPPNTTNADMAHVVTEENRALVRKWIKVLTVDQVAHKLGFGRDILMSKYRKELDEGIAEAVAAVGSKLLKKAMGGDKTCMIFFLRTRGKWSVRHEIGGFGGGPIRTLDTSGMSREQLEALLPVLEQMGDGAVDGYDDSGPASDAGVFPG